MKIGEISLVTFCSVETIRYYEKEGLLPAAGRSEANYRIYSDAHLERLIFIRRCRLLDMSLEEISTLLGVCDISGGDCAPIDALIDGHLGHVEARIQELHALQQQLRDLRKQCVSPGKLSDCGVLKNLSNTVVNEKEPAGHVPRTHR
jgi:Cd(II)/Pb(II)-responsive transcriptional regulator